MQPGEVEEQESVESQSIMDSDDQLSDSDISQQLSSTSQSAKKVKSSTVRGKSIHDEEMRMLKSATDYLGNLKSNKQNIEKKMSLMSLEETLPMNFAKLRTLLCWDLPKGISIIQYLMRKVICFTTPAMDFKVVRDGKQMHLISRNGLLKSDSLGICPTIHFICEMMITLINKVEKILHYL